MTFHTSCIYVISYNTVMAQHSVCADNKQLTHGLLLLRLQAEQTL